MGAADAAATATNGPVAATTAPAASAAVAGTAKPYVMTGLTKGTAYDVYCATGTVVKKLDNQKTSGVAATCTGDAIGGKQLVLSATADISENIRCGVYANDATAPTAVQVN